MTDTHTFVFSGPAAGTIEWLLDEDNINGEEFQAYVATLNPVERQDLLDRLEAHTEVVPWEPLPHQTPPADDDWYGWMLLAGRGSGKTAAITHWINNHALGPPCLTGPVPHRMGIIAPTLGDASASIVHGDDGLKLINPQVREITKMGGTIVEWPNGAFAYLFGVHTRIDIDRLRAKGNRCADVREEIAAWRYLREGMYQADFGLRRGPHPRWVGATTPRPRPTIRRLDTSPIVRVNRATTQDNPHLPEARRRQLYEEYGNTRIGLQELQGVILEDVTGALWTQELIEQWRVQADEVPRLLRVRTYVDPSWGTTNDECGIIVAGLGVDRHAYILADLSRRATPGEWGLIAALGRLPGPDELLAEAEPAEWFGRVSERTIYESNFQGEQVKLVMKLTSRDLNRRLLAQPVTASRGKRIRAEPVVALTERGKVHVVGSLAGLEFQLTNWVPPEGPDLGDDAGDPVDADQEASGWSPDRLDAFVFAVTDLLLGPGSGVAKLEIADGRVPETRQIAQAHRAPASVPQVGAIPRATRQRRIAEETLGQPLPDDTPGPPAR